jgi:hypothetical protein
MPTAAEHQQAYNGEVRSEPFNASKTVHKSLTPKMTATSTQAVQGVGATATLTAHARKLSPLRVSTQLPGLHAAA